MPKLKRMSQSMRSRKKKSSRQNLRTDTENIATAESMPHVPVDELASISVTDTNQQNYDNHESATKSKHTYPDWMERYLTYSSDQQREKRRKTEENECPKWKNISTRNAQPGPGKPPVTHTDLEVNVAMESTKDRKKQSKCVLMRTKRSREEYRSRENKMRNIQRKQTRNSDEYSANEKKRNITRKNQRSSEEYKAQETKKRNVSRKRKRSQEEYKTQENEIRNVSRKRKRTLNGYRKQEHEIRNVSRKRKRTLDGYRKHENEIRNVSRKRKRTLDGYRKQENEIRNVSKKRKRSHIEYRKQEKEIRNVSRIRKRTDTSYRDNEHKKRNASRGELRKNPDYREREKQAAQPQTLAELVSTFHTKVSQGPVYVCSCCDQLWYRHSVSCVTNIKQLENNSVASVCKEK